MDFMGAQQGMGAGGAIGEALMSLVGEAIAAGDYDRAQGLITRLQSQYDNQPLPDLKEYNPEMAGPTAYGNVHVDPKYGAQEDAALAEMVRRSRGGMMPEDEANLMRARVDAQGNASATSAMLDRMNARRGMTRSGSAGVGKQIAAQQASNRLYQGGVQAAGDASQRALQALSMAGGYASNLAGRDLNQKNMAAGATDRISQFNLGRKDAAAGFNNQVRQQGFENRQGQLDRIAALLGPRLGLLQKQTNSTKGALRGFGNLAGSVIGAVAGGS